MYRRMVEGGRGGGGGGAGKKKAPGQVERVRDQFHSHTCLHSIFMFYNNVSSHTHTHTHTQGPWPYLASAAIIAAIGIGLAYFITQRH